MKEPMDIPEEIWEQDLNNEEEWMPHPIAGPLGPSALAPEGLGREEPGWSKKTPLPHNFRCMAGHWHTIANVDELLREDTPICLLRRVVLEWAAL